MTEELTSREQLQMQDTLLAATQRIRPAVSRRATIPAVIAVVLVAGTVGGIVTTSLNSARVPDGPIAPAPTETIIDPLPTLSTPLPIATEPGAPALPRRVTAPPPATHLTLQPVPEYDVRLILGTSEGLHTQGIDVASAQGFQSVSGIHPWIANLRDGSGQCILIRKDYQSGGWSEIVCDAGGAPAAVEREVDGDVLRFTIVDGHIDVTVLP